MAEKMEVRGRHAMFVILNSKLISQKVWIQNYSLPFMLQFLTRSQLHDGLSIYPFLLTLVSSSPILGQTEAVCIAGSLPYLSLSKKPSAHPGCLSKSFHLLLLSLFMIRWRKANSSIFRVKEMTTPLQDPSLRFQPTILQPIDMASESAVKV